MTVKVVCAIFILLPAIVLCLIRGSPCTTPNGEAAICKSVRDCKVIFDAVYSRNKDAIAFGRKSQCGYDSEPLVCCGSTGYPKKEVAPASLSPLLPERSSCGLTRGFRVFGGELTQIWEHPWMALLRYKNTDGTDAGFKCGGTLISKRYVLSAAHCVLISNRERFSLDSVRLGEWRLSTTKDCEVGLVNEECADPVLDIQIIEKIVNDNYGVKTGEHDIALLRLSQNVIFTDYVRPICLPEPNAPIPPEGTKLVVVGWGATENSSTSDDKLKVQVPIVSLKECSEKLSIRGRHITDYQVCAGGVDKKDSCRGDSGGPLMGSSAKHIGDTNQWYQEGVVSWGVGCGLAGYPAIYTRVSRYISWIVDNIKE